MLVLAARSSDFCYTLKGISGIIVLAQRMRAITKCSMPNKIQKAFAPPLLSPSSYPEVFYSMILNEGDRLYSVKVFKITIATTMLSKLAVNTLVVGL